MSHDLNIGEDTFILFAVPSFVEGMGRVLDMGSSFEIYNEFKTPLEADRNALEHDWKAIGKDIFFSLRQQEQLPNEQPA